MLLWLRRRPDEPVWTSILWLASSLQLSWNEAVIHGIALSVCVSLYAEWLMFSLLFAPISTARAVGWADFKCWWSSDSDWAWRYIFIILQSTPKTLLLVFKVQDVKNAVWSWTVKLAILKAGCSTMSVFFPLEPAIWWVMKLYSMSSWI